MREIKSRNLLDRNLFLVSEFSKLENKNLDLSVLICCDFARINEHVMQLWPQLNGYLTFELLQGKVGEKAETSRLTSFLASRRKHPFTIYTGIH